MAGRFEQQTPTSPGRRSRSALAGVTALLVLALLAAPAATAVDYQGPGQEGRVPVGIGDVLAQQAPLVGADVTQIPLEGVPDAVCRVVLDENGTYGATQVVWSPGDETAYVAAEPGALEAPFQIHAHWERDINDNCTVEVTPDRTIWHDPRGRAFTEPRFVERFLHYDVQAGSWFKVEAQIHNNGTRTETINADLEHLRETWELQNASSLVGVEVEPLQTVRLTFEIHIPADEAGGKKLLLLNAQGQKSGWVDRATFVIEVEEDVEARHGAGDEDGEEEEEGIDSKGSAKPPSQPGSRTGQIPVVGPAALLVTVAFLLCCLRRRGA